MPAIRTDCGLEMAESEFTLLPAFYQANWFRAAMAGLFFLALCGLYRVLVHQVASEVVPPAESIMKPACAAFGGYGEWP